VLLLLLLLRWWWCVLVLLLLLLLLWVWRRRWVGLRGLVLRWRWVGLVRGLWVGLVRGRRRVGLALVAGTQVVVHQLRDDHLLEGGVVQIQAAVHHLHRVPKVSIAQRVAVVKVTI